MSYCFKRPEVKTLPFKSFSEYVSRDESIMSDLMSKRNTGISSSQNSTLRSATEPLSPVHLEQISDK